MESNVLDFTDLGKGIEFMYRGEKFEIPSYTKSEMSNLMRLSEQMLLVSKSLTKEEKEKLDSGDVSVSDADNDGNISSSKLSELFKAQQDFIVSGVIQVTPDGIKVPLTIEKIEPWPWKLSNRVSSLVQEMMSSVSGVEKSEDKKKNPTKEN